jgi:hypothetical protein
MEKIAGIERVQAFTPKDVMNVKLDIRSLNNLVTRSKTSHMDVGSLQNIACFLSHRKIWQKMLDDNIEDAVIFEDDAIVKSLDFPAVSKDEPFAWLGLRGKVQSKDDHLIFNRLVYGAHAYRVHISLIPHLLYFSNTITLSVDFYLNEVLSVLDIKPLYKPRVTTNEFMSKSDIVHLPPVASSSNSFFHLVAIFAILKVLFDFLKYVYKLNIGFRIF